MRDLLYILGGGSKHGDAELRYSLRSVEANCTGYGRVWLVGRKPEWMNDKVEFVACDDPYDCTHKNMMHKILKVVHETDISDDFVMQGDDHFYVRPYDFREIQPYEKGELPTEFKANEIAPHYRTSLMDTRRHLIAHGYPFRNGSQHCGQPFRKSLLLQVEDELFKPAFNYPYGLEGSSLMAAALVRYGGMKYQYRHDCKFAHFDGERGLMERIGNDFCFSIYDRAFEFGLEAILQKWFPKRSSFEGEITT